MIKALRRKFILIAMSSVIVVLSAIIGIINITNYCNINNSINKKITVLAENNGIFPKLDFKDDKRDMHNKDFSPEAPFETRYFSVILRNDGTVISVNTGKIAAISTSTAQEYAVNLYNNNSKEGFIDNYKYICVENNNDLLYIFLDCGKDLSTFYSFLAVSVLVSFVGILLVFILVVICSKIAIMPIAESYEKQKQFITNASHEIKTPLTIIDANTEVIEMVSGENEWTQSIKKQIKRLTSLTEELVFLSRMDEGTNVLQMLEFSISDAVYETSKPFITLAETQGKILNLNIQKNITYNGDEAAIRQLVSLLLDNAIKYSDSKGTINVEFKEQGKTKELNISNTASQLPNKKLDILFDRFYRLDSSHNSETGGHGIGLSVAKSIVNAHKGKITADSKNNTITFSIEL